MVSPTNKIARLALFLTQAVSAAIGHNQIILQYKMLVYLLLKLRGDHITSVLQ